MQITIQDDLFDSMREDFDDILNNLLNKMHKANELTGTMSVSLRVNLTPMTYTDPDTGELMNVLIPDFTHKIKSTIKKGEETTGASCGMKQIVFTSEGMKIEKINNGQQTMFD